MKKNSLMTICVFFLILVLILTGCSTSKQTNSNSTVSEYSNVADALKFKGYKVIEIEPSEYDKTHSFFSVYARFIDADGNRISVYEFSNSKDAKAEVKTISKDGSTIGKVKVSWISTPHFYNAGNLIIEYTGDNKKFLSDLEIIFGKPVTNYIQSSI